jgi:hypothetical protein
MGTPAVDDVVRELRDNAARRGPNVSSTRPEINTRMGRKDSERGPVDAAFDRAVSEDRVREHPRYAGFYYLPEHEDQIVFPSK